MRNRNRCYVLSIITVYTSPSHDSVCVCVCVCVYVHVCVVPYGFDGYLDRWQHVRNLKRKNNRPSRNPSRAACARRLHLSSKLVCSLAHHELSVWISSGGVSPQRNITPYLFSLSLFNSDVWLCCASPGSKETYRSRHVLRASMQITLLFSTSKTYSCSSCTERSVTSRLQRCTSYHLEKTFIVNASIKAPFINFISK